MLPTIKKTIPQNKTFVPAKSGYPFDPLTYPGTVALWDGDVTLNLNTGWTAASSGLELIDFTGSTTLPLNGSLLNGHNTVIFNGIDQYGNSPIPVIGQPFTMYLVARQITYPGLGYYLTDDGLNALQNALITFLANNEFLLASSSGNILNTNFILNTFQVITIQVNGSNSFLKINLTNSVYGDIGHNLNCNGISLSVDIGKAFYLNCEFAYIIMRNTADNAVTQNKFINYLKNRFAI
jgi:hypothetical protein